ncbi:MAG TPA: TIGR03118 family protein [Rhizomicrobium sp.]|nr:TIGR03118 family protein [Rhizomicrobium sp.]
MKKEAYIVLCAALFASPVFAAGGHGIKPPATTFEIIPLVSDQAGVAPNTDPDLVNPWGISHIPGGPNWVADNGTDKSTVYSRANGTKSNITVNVIGAPTGTVAPLDDHDGDTDFPVTKNGNTGASAFIFDTESGTIQGWSGSVDAVNAVVAVDRSTKGSVYKGLALDSVNQNLYAADFAKNQVQVFDDQWKPIGKFTDTELPRRFAPFNVAVINGKVYVAFAKRERGGIDELHGKGLGYVDVFDLGGNLQQHLIANGPLNAPWGMAIAPSGFGDFAGALLVGNFGDGKVNAFDASTGAFLGTLSGSDGKPLKIDGLWTLDPGPSNNQVSFSAGPGDETHGLLGLIQPN